MRKKPTTKSSPEDAATKNSVVPNAKRRATPKVPHELFPEIDRIMKFYGIRPSDLSAESEYYRLKNCLPNERKDRPQRLFTIVGELDREVRKKADAEAKSRGKDSADDYKPITIETLQQALRSVSEAFEEQTQERLNDASGNPETRRRLLELLAALQESERRWIPAAATLQKLVSLCENELHDPVDAAQWRARLGDALVRADESDMRKLAEQVIREALGNLRGVNGNRAAMHTELELWLNLVLVLIRQKRDATADRVIKRFCRPLFAQLVSSTKSSGSPHYKMLEAKMNVRHGVALKGLKKFPGATHLLVKGLCARSSLRDTESLARGLRHLAQVHHQVGMASTAPNDATMEFKRALWLFAESLALFRQSGDERETARTHLFTGMLLREFSHLYRNIGEEKQSNELQSMTLQFRSFFADEELSLVEEVVKLTSGPGVWKSQRNYRMSAIHHLEKAMSLARSRWPQSIAAHAEKVKKLIDSEE